MGSYNSLNGIFSSIGDDTSASLSFASREKAQAQVEDLLTKLNLPQRGKVEIFAFSADLLNRLYEEHKEQIEADYKRNVSVNKDTPEPRRQWEKGQEYYVVQGVFNYEGIPSTLYSYTHQAAEQRIDRSWYQAIVNKDGIQYFNLGNSIIFRNIEVKEQPQFILSLQQAVAALKERYSEIMYLDITITRISFEYVALPAKGKLLSFEVVPCWAFYNSDGVNVDRINAVTGKLIT
jgi:hypothetical protein